MELLLALLLLLLVAAIWTFAFGGSSTSVDRARRSSVEANRAAMQGETGKWRIEPSDSDRSGPPPIKRGPRGGRYTEAKTRQDKGGVTGDISDGTLPRSSAVLTLAS